MREGGRERRRRGEREGEKEETREEGRKGGSEMGRDSSYYSMHTTLLGQRSRCTCTCCRYVYSMPL